MSFQSSRQTMIQSRGRQMVLKRLTGSVSTGGITTQSLPLTGFFSVYNPQEILGAVMQGDAQVSVLHTEIAAAGWDQPQTRDQIEIDGKTWAVVGSSAVYDGEVCIGHRIWIRGGAG